MAMLRLLIALLVAAVLPLSAAEIATIAGAAAQEPLIAMAKAFEQQTGHAVKIRFDTVPNLARQIAAGDPAASADVFVGSAAAVEQAIKDGKANGTARMPLGRIGIGVAVSRGAAKPDVSSVDALKAALMKADAVVTSQGTSGGVVMKMLADIGIYEQIKQKTRQVGSGVAVMEQLGKSKNEIGFTMISEVDVRRGARRRQSRRAAAGGDPELHRLRGGRADLGESARTKRGSSSARSARRRRASSSSPAAGRSPTSGRNSASSVTRERTLLIKRG